MCSNYSFGNDKIQPKSKITKVTVFPTGAMVTREIDISKLKGEHTLQLNGLPNDILKKSIIVEGHDNIDIVSVMPYLDNSVQFDSLLSSELGKQSLSISDSLAYYNALHSSLMSEKNMILDHDDFENDNGNSNIEDVIKASEFYKKRIREIEIAFLIIERTKRHFNKEMQDLRIRFDSLNNMASKTEFKVKIKVKIIDKNAKPIDLKYFVPNASWHMFYDLKVKDIDQPAVLNRKAYVKQNTGEAWTNVNISLSNANPLQNNHLPILNPEKLTDPYLQNTNDMGKTYGTVVDELGLPLIGANIMYENTQIGIITDINGNFEIKFIPKKRLKISYVGYDTQFILASNYHNRIVMKENSNLLSEVVITGTSAGTIDGYGINQLKQKQALKEAEENSKKQEAIYLLRNAIGQTKVKTINSIEYQIKEKYTINSEDKEIDVLLAIEDINCVYEYFAIPKKSSSTYLTLQIPNWHELDFLEGEVNLFLGNTYKGKSSINPKVTSDTLRISIGIDPEVVVERKLIQEDYDKKILSKKIEEYFTFKTTVKNNKSKSVTVKILDQIPVSTHEDIEIKNLKLETVILDKKSGLYDWTLDLSPGESASNTVSYSVKYPKKFRGIIN